MILVWILVRCGSQCFVLFWFFLKSSSVSKLTNTNFPLEFSTKCVWRAGFVWQLFCVAWKCLTSFIPIEISEESSVFRQLIITGLGKRWANNCQNMTPSVDIRTNTSLKMRTVVLHRYCFPGTSYGEKKNAEMRKDWPLRLAEEYLGCPASYRLVRGNRVN